MFAPNRLLTTKEQWLLIGFTVAIITGCATLFLYEGSMGNAGAKEHVSETTVISTKAQVPQTQTENPPVTATVSRSPEEKKEGIGAAAASPAVPQLIGVAVMGAVNRPGLYMLNKGTRIVDLIARAGGATKTADLSDILLTAPLVDETTLSIPEESVVTMKETQLVVKRRKVASAVNPLCYCRSRVSAPSYTSPSTEQAGTPPAVRPPANVSVSLPGVPLNINQASSEQLQKLPGIGPAFAERIINERSRQPFMSVEELKRVSGIGDKRLETVRPFITAP